MGFFKSLLSSMGRTLGRILIYIFIGLLIYFLFSDKSLALTYSSSNQVLSDTYYNLFSGYIDKLDYKSNYVAFSYYCNSSNSSYNQTCYALCYGPDLTYNNDSFVGSCNYVKYDYNSDNSREIFTGFDNTFSFSGDVYYSNLGNSSSLEGGISIYEKVVIIFISIVVCNYVISRLFFKR
ncbi:MAG: hypothetical protein ACI4WU_03655 [Bacilli bacterium]